MQVAVGLRLLRRRRAGIHGVVHRPLMLVRSHARDMDTRRTRTLVAFSARMLVRFLLQLTPGISERHRPVKGKLPRFRIWIHTKIPLTFKLKAIAGRSIGK